jgi:hypothetical protein
MSVDAPKYLGIKLDRALNFKQHLEDVKNKLKTRNNIISKLAGTSWGYQEDGNVKNRHLISDPTQRVPGFEYPRTMWTNLNRIRTEHGKCKYLLHQWKIRISPHCDCGQIQSIRYIVEECPQTRYKNGIEALHKFDDKAMNWLSNTFVRL